MALKGHFKNGDQGGGVGGRHSPGHICLQFSLQNMSRINHDFNCVLMFVANSLPKGGLQHQHYKWPNVKRFACSPMYIKEFKSKIYIGNEYVFTLWGFPPTTLCPALTLANDIQVIIHFSNALAYIGFQMVPVQGHRFKNAFQMVLLSKSQR